MTQALYEKAMTAAQFIRSQWTFPIKAAVVLGSGLGAFAEQLDDRREMAYRHIPHFPVSTAEGHAGRLVLGWCQRIPVAVMQGRFHYYEGYTLEEVTFPIRVFGLLGIKTLILTNAAGGINRQFEPGSLMLIADHLNLMGANPLRGWNDARFGPRFPDMTMVYSKAYRDLAKREAAAMGLKLEEGVYVAVSGPSYETPAEIRMLRTLGADAVGMSTVPEAIVARHMGMDVLGLSLIANMAAGVLERPLDHREVLEMGERMSGVITAFLRRLVPRLVEPSLGESSG
ncbi:MAG: purine-nucleoside phosphorylase [Acidobacteria bacterium]|nr:MAG: purine-nucleoside phosphorylase [Acidobacteriota bacterium]